MSLALACVTGELRGGGAVQDGTGDALSTTDLFEALPAPATVGLVAPPVAARVFLDPRIPPTRVTTADVFRPPQARS
jgi:hypothetical protein